MNKCSRELEKGALQGEKCIALNLAHFSCGYRT